MHRSGKSVIKATPQAQEAWVAHVNDIVTKTLFPCTNSWYMSANIPGGRARRCSTAIQNCLKSF
jgi:cyclohexanone monooxygenase